MNVLENFTKRVTDTAKAAAKRSGELVEITKLNMSIGAEEDKIQKLYADIGKKVYESYSNGSQVEEAFQEGCDKIKAYQQNIKEMKEKIYELKNVKECPQCKGKMEMNALYCSQCGEKQPEKKVVFEDVEEPIEKICPSCNMTNDLTSSYCSKCGARLEEDLM